MKAKELRECEGGEKSGWTLVVAFKCLSGSPAEIAVVVALVACSTRSTATQFSTRVILLEIASGIRIIISS
jgi:hypothetical protein